MGYGFPHTLVQWIVKIVGSVTENHRTTLLFNSNRKGSMYDGWGAIKTAQEV